MTPKSKIFLIFLILGLVLGAIYWQPLYHHPLLQYDDQATVVPMKQVHSFQKYVQLYRDNIINDRLPVRDFIYWAQFRVADLTGFLNFQFINLLIWFLTLIGIFRCMELEKISTFMALFFLSLGAMHPLVVNSVAWPTAQKHLISALCIAWATFFWLRLLSTKGRHFGFFAILLYILANLAQPINIGWIGWAVIVAFLEKRHGSLEIKISGALGILIGASIAAMNYFYYTGASYAALTGETGTKFVDSEVNTLGVRILIWGRDLVQILIPIKPSISSYAVGTSLNMIGVILMPIVIFIFYKFVEKETFIKWGLFILFPILVMTVKLTHQPGWDTYLLVPLLGFTILTAHLAQTFFQKTKFKFRTHSNPILANSILTCLFLVLFGVEGYATHTQANAWRRDDTLWVRAVTLEPSFLNRSGYALSLVAQQRFSEAWPIVEELFKEKPNEGEVQFLVGQTIFGNKDFSANEKESLFKRFENTNPWFNYFWSAFDAQQGNFNRAERRIREGWEKNPQRYVLTFRDQVTSFAAKWFLMCKEAQLTDCDRLPNEIQKVAPPSRWSDELFKGQLAKYGK